MGEPLHELKTELYAMQIKRAEVAKYCDIGYSQLSCYLNGITPMPYVVLKKIRKLIDEKKAEV